MAEAVRPGGAVLIDSIQLTLRLVGKCLGWRVTASRLAATPRGSLRILPGRIHPVLPGPRILKREDHWSERTDRRRAGRSPEITIRQQINEKLLPRPTSRRSRSSVISLNAITVRYQHRPGESGRKCP